MLTPLEKLQKIRELCEDAIQTDGDHHKQWYLVQIGEVVGIDIEVDEPGIAP